MPSKLAARPPTRTNAPTDKLTTETACRIRPGSNGSGNCNERSTSAGKMYMIMLAQRLETMPRTVANESGRIAKPVALPTKPTDNDNRPAKLVTPQSRLRLAMKKRMVKAKLNWVAKATLAQ